LHRPNFQFLRFPAALVRLLPNTQVHNILLQAPSFKIKQYFFGRSFDFLGSFSGRLSDFIVCRRGICASRPLFQKRFTAFVFSAASDNNRPSFFYKCFVIIQIDQFFYIINLNRINLHFKVFIKTSVFLPFLAASTQPQSRIYIIQHENSPQ